MINDGCSNAATEIKSPILLSFVDISNSSITKLSLK